MAYILLLMGALARLALSELIVNTSSGPVRGVYNDTAHTVRAFLGIPYAESPTNERRFAPPSWKEYSEEVYDSSRFGPVCPGIYDYMLDNQSIWHVLPYHAWNYQDVDEDCLSINIWAPSSRHRYQAAGTERNHKSPVIVFIPGGGFYEGGTALEWYDGSNIVQNNDDIIVVTFNYRQTVFGYPNAPELSPTQQNVGLLDQRLAVEWVYRNIANFGGDADKIMLWGESAGAASVDIYSFAYYDDPIVRATAMNSGSANIVQSSDYAHDSWKKLASLLGCTDSETLACMRTISVTKIISTLSANENLTYAFAPIPDNATYYSNGTDRILSGKFPTIPTLIGTNARESAADLPLNSTTIDETMIDVATATTFNCPSLAAASQRLLAGTPVWRYLYHGNFSNLSPTPWLGAYHASELPMIFGTYFKSPLCARNFQEEMDTSRYMQTAWVEFAKDPWMGLTKLGWPQWDPSDSTLINLGSGNGSIVLTKGSELDIACSED